MKIIIELKTDNAAFEDYAEMKRCLGTTIAKICLGRTDGKIMDINGNSVGSFEVTK